MCIPLCLIVVFVLSAILSVCNLRKTLYSILYMCWDQPTDLPNVFWRGWVNIKGIFFSHRMSTDTSQSYKTHVKEHICMFVVQNSGKISLYYD